MSVRGLLGPRIDHFFLRRYKFCLREKQHEDKIEHHEVD